MEEEEGKEVVVEKSEGEGRKEEVEKGGITKVKREEVKAERREGRRSKKRRVGNRERERE